eukprot:1196098-Prorocentrum_minimum.AAC.4
MKLCSVVCKSSYPEPVAGPREVVHRIAIPIDEKGRPLDTAGGLPCSEALSGRDSIGRAGSEALSGRDSVGRAGSEALSGRDSVGRTGEWALSGRKSIGRAGAHVSADHAEQHFHRPDDQPAERLPPDFDDALYPGLRRRPQDPRAGYPLQLPLTPSARPPDVL